MLLRNKLHNQLRGVISPEPGSLQLQNVWPDQQYCLRRHKNRQPNNNATLLLQLLFVTFKCWIHFFFCKLENSFINLPATDTMTLAGISLKPSPSIVTTVPPSRLPDVGNTLWITKNDKWQLLTIIGKKKRIPLLPMHYLVSNNQADSLYKLQ